MDDALLNKEVVIVLPTTTYPEYKDLSDNPWKT